MPVRWDDLYATGEPKIDDQHRRLFDMVNKLEIQLQQANMDRPLIESIVYFIAIYVKTHFTYEEKYMDRLQCPAAQQNKEEHAQFVQVFQVLQERFTQEGVTHDLVQQLYTATQTMVVDHICKVDMQLKECQKKK